MSTFATNRFLRRELDNFQKTNEIGQLYGELKYSTLIVPVNDKEFMTVNVDGRKLIPCFTDIHEYQKLNPCEDFQPKAYYFNFYLELLERECSGFVLNPKSENFIISQDILEVMDTDYMFDLDYMPFTVKEIERIYNSIDNSKIQEFIENDCWDLEELMEILLKSDLLTLINTEGELDEIDDTGIYGCFSKVSYECIKNYALLFSKPLIGRNVHNSYSQLVNLPLFIDEALKNDLSGIMLDSKVILPRDFLIDFMMSFKGPFINDYSFYAFSLEGK